MRTDDVLRDLERQLRDATDRRPSPWPAVRAAAPVLVVAAALVVAVVLAGLPSGDGSRDRAAHDGRQAGEPVVADTRLLRDGRGLVAVVNNGARDGLAARWADILLGLGGRTAAFSSPNPGSTDGTMVIVHRGDRELGRGIRSVTGGRLQVSDTLGRFFGAPDRARAIVVLGKGAKDVAPVTADPPVVYVAGVRETDAERDRKIERLRTLGVDGVETARSVRSVIGLRLLATPEAEPAVVRRVQLAFILRARRASATQLERLGAPAGTQVVVLSGDAARPRGG